MKKTILAAAAGAAAAIGTLSLLGATCPDAISTPAPVEVVAPPAADTAPEPTIPPVPADLSAELPADPEDLPWTYQEAVPWVPGAPYTNPQIFQPYQETLTVDPLKVEPEPTTCISGNAQ